MEDDPRDSDETRQFEVTTSPDDPWGEKSLRAAGATDREVEAVRSQLAERFGDPPPHGTRHKCEFQYLVRYERLAGREPSEDDERMWDSAFLATQFEKVARLESAAVDTLVQSPFVAAEVPTVAVYPSDQPESELDGTVITMLGPIKALGPWHDFWQWIAPSYKAYLEADEALDPDELDAENPLESLLHEEATAIEGSGEAGTVVLDDVPVPAMVYSGGSVSLVTVELEGLSVLAYSMRKRAALRMETARRIPLAPVLGHEE